MEADVYFCQVRHAALFEFFFVAPAFVSDDQLSELRAPVAKVIDPHGIISAFSVHSVKRRAYHRRGQMPDMERLRDINRAVIDTHGFARSLVGRTVLRAPFQDVGKHFARLGCAVELEIQITVDGFHRGERIRTRQNIFFQFLRNQRGRFPERFRESETRQRIIAHRGVGRQHQKRSDLLAGYVVYVDVRSDFCFSRIGCLHIYFLITFPPATW